MLWYIQNYYKYGLFFVKEFNLRYLRGSETFMQTALWTEGGENVVPHHLAGMGHYL
jgi:hypothetical protein